jgi:NDP-sugar pyrophosphorylase family protein
LRKKARLTITLSPKLLKRIDQMIDGQTVRSRSHAIETLLRRSLVPRVRTAAILAGGEPKGQTLPALASIDGQPLLQLLCQHLSAAGIERFVILGGGHEAIIRQALDGKNNGTTVYVNEPEPAGTAGALKLATPYLAEDPSFLVIHGDVLTDIDVGDFVAFHEREGTLATIAVKPRRAEANYGKVLLQGNRITDFYQRGDGEGVSIVNTGVYLLRPAVLRLIAAERPTYLERDIFPQLAGMGELSAFFFQGVWFDISSPENYRLAVERWRKKGGMTDVGKEG